MARKKKVVQKKPVLVKGDMVQVTGGNNWMREGDQGMVVTAGVSSVRVSSTRTHDTWNIETSRLKKIELPKVKFMLQYLAESDPFELFITIEEVKSRVNQLLQDEDYETDADSFIVYDISKTRKLTAKKTVDIKGL